MTPAFLQLPSLIGKGFCSGLGYTPCPASRYSPDQRTCSLSRIFSKRSKLFCKKLVIILKLQAKQWKCLDERTTADNHLRPALRQKINGCEFLEYSYRVSGTQHCYGTGEPYSICSRGCGW